MTQKRTLSLLFFGLLMIMLCSCSRKEADPGVQKTEEGGLQKIFGTASNKLPKDIVEEGDFFEEFDVDIVEGTINCRVNSSASYKNINDAGFKYDDLVQVREQVDPNTGEMLDGSVLVVLEITVKNEDASTAINPDGITFRADDLQLVDISKMVTDANYEFHWPNYFSESGECESIWGYNLEKGSTLDYTVAYISPSDNLENLYLCNTSGHIDSTFVRLNFGAN